MGERGVQALLLKPDCIANKTSHSNGTSSAHLKRSLEARELPGMAAVTESDSGAELLLPGGNRQC